jgi:2-aminoethylphosphonate-pyruvate transaminase
MDSEPNDPWLLTPGPLTTSLSVKQAMLHDWGSRDAAFIEMNARVRGRLVEIANATDTHVCVPLQGSGTFTVEAAIGTLVPPTGKLLILVNGAYGHRIAKICQYLGRDFVCVETPEDTPVDVDAADALLAADTGISHVAVIHCETTSGIINPIEQVAAMVSRHGRSLLIDAMSAFGAIELDGQQIPFDALMASSNKCLEGVPGLGYAIIRKTALEKCAGNAHSLSLDLYEQWLGLEGNGQWRFTPPIHVIASLDQAISEFRQEGGVAGRGKRYADNCRILIDGMRALGFETLLPDHLQAPIIVTFRTPTDPKFVFNTFYDKLVAQGFIIYPGKLTVADSFRIGCIGRLYAEQMNGVLEAIRNALSEMGVTNCSSTKAA